MRRGRSACSDSSEIDLIGIAEAELIKLQRQFRVMERGRKTYGVESQDFIRRQQRHIQRLQSEQEELQRSIRVSGSPFRRCNDAHATQSLSSMLAHRDRVEEWLKSEQKEVIHLKQEILNLEKKLAGQRRGGSTTFLCQKSESHQMQHTCRILENNVDRGLVRFNKALTKNGKLREELKILHVERKQFLNLYSRMERELQGIRKDIWDTMSQSTAAFEARVEAWCKRMMLKEKAVKDQAQHGRESSELERVITHDHHLKTFLDTKAKERISQDEGQDLSCRHVKKQRRRLDSGERMLDTFEEAFHKIHCVTGEKDFDKLVGAFVKTEENIFSLSNFVNDQNNEAELLKEQINEIKREMERYAIEEREKQEEHHALLRRIDTQQQATEEQVEAYRHRINSVDNILDELKTGIECVFHSINCDHSVIEDKLGSSTGISDATIMTYLGVVEQRTNELLTLESFLSSKDLDEQHNPRILRQMQNIPVEPPTPGEDNDPAESLLMDQMMPFCKEQLLPLASERILRKAEIVQSEVTTSHRRSLVVKSPLCLQEALSGEKQHRHTATPTL